MAVVLPTVSGSHQTTHLGATIERGELDVLYCCLSATCSVRMYYADWVKTMANTTNHMTADELASLPDDGNRRELVDGVLHMMSPAGGRHGRIAGRLFLRIGNHVEQGKLGEVFAAETGYLLSQDPDTVRAPDVSFVSSERLGEFADYAGYLPLAPIWLPKSCLRVMNR